MILPERFGDGCWRWSDCIRFSRTTSLYTSPNYEVRSTNKPANLVKSKLPNFWIRTSDKVQQQLFQCLIGSVILNQYIVQYIVLHNSHITGAGLGPETDGVVRTIGEIFLLCGKVAKFALQSWYCNVSTANDSLLAIFMSFPGELLTDAELLDIMQLHNMGAISPPIIFGRLSGLSVLQHCKLFRSSFNCQKNSE